MQDLKIHFELRDLDDVQPWGDRSTGLSLHWFGLTDGWYDLQIGENHLFQTVDADEPGVGYQVVRLWEDLIDVAHVALEPLPQALAPRLADADAWSAWTDRAFELDDDSGVVQTALSWWWHRQMSALHLRGAPYLDFWRLGEELHVRWWSHPREPDGPHWASPAGSAVLSADAFRNELVRFDRELIDQMRARVEQVAQHWSRPEVRIDVDQLRREHTTRSAHLVRTLSDPFPRNPRKQSWDDVLAAIAEIERRIGPSQSG
jgi:hypothetical protein